MPRQMRRSLLIMRSRWAELARLTEYMQCNICVARANVALVPCGHRYCDECMARMHASRVDRPSCAFCRQSYTETIPSSPRIRLHDGLGCDLAFQGTEAAVEVDRKMT